MLPDCGIVAFTSSLSDLDLDFNQALFTEITTCYSLVYFSKKKNMVHVQRRCETFQNLLKRNPINIYLNGDIQYTNKYHF